MTELSTQQIEQLKIIYQTAPMGIAMVNDAFKFITCNPTLLRKLGYSLQEIQSKTLIEVCHLWDRDTILKLIHAAREQQSRYTRGEVRLFHHDRPYLWVLISIQWVPPQDGEPDSFVVMIENIQQRKEMQFELMELRRRLMDSNEAERNKLAQDLHDGPMQDLHSITYQIAAMEDEVSEEVRSNLMTIQNTVNGINRELRAIAYNLRPPALSKFGLAQSIKSHADEFMAKHPEQHIQLELVTDRGVIAEEVRIALFRIYQQSMANIMLHANATQVTIRLNLDGDAVTLEIQDNGQGFNVPEKWLSLVRAGHYGLAGTKDRVEALGGDFKVISAPGEGTHIIVSIPDYMES